MKNLKDPCVYVIGKIGQGKGARRSQSKGPGCGCPDPCDGHMVPDDEQHLLPPSAVPEKCRWVGGIGGD